MGRQQWSGKVSTYIIVYHPVHPTVKDKVPYNVVLVELEEGVKIVSNIADYPLPDIKIGMPVEVVFDKITKEVTLPRLSLPVCRLRPKALNNLLDT